MKTFFLSLVIFVVSAVLLVFAAYLFLVDTSPMGKMEYLAETGKFTIFRYTGYGDLDDHEIKRMYENGCTRKCHSRDVIERTVHTAKEWEDIVNRMRTVNNASVTDAEAAAVTAYLAKRYGSNIPTILSVEGGRYLKKYLWRSDFGEEDLYVDIIYSPVEYFKVIGGRSIVEGFSTKEYELFKVYINTHQNKLDKTPLDKLAILTTNEGKEYRPERWVIIYESGDSHHREALLVFKKIDESTSSFAIGIEGLPGRNVRLFDWEVPIPETSL